jgi:hypothetical protein
MTLFRGKSFFEILNEGLFVDCGLSLYRVIIALIEGST